MMTTGSSGGVGGMTMVFFFVEVFCYFFYAGLLLKGCDGFNLIPVYVTEARDPHRAALFPTADLLPGYSSKFLFYAFDEQVDGTVVYYAGLADLPLRGVILCGVDTLEQHGWMRTITFYAYPNAIPGAELISVGERYNPHCLMLNHDNVTDYDGWTARLNFWAFTSVEAFTSLPLHPPGPWECILSFTSPMRYNSYNQIECMSLNHHDCLWGDNVLDCLNSLTIDTLTVIQPLTCGEYHYREWGITGYDTPVHWCGVGLDYYNAPWQCVPGFSAPVRFIDGNVECMSFNHHDCYWDGGSCDSKLSTPLYTIQPLTCGEEYQQEWDINGYDDPDHWCSRVYSLLDPSGLGGPWECILNFTSPIRWNGDFQIECMSFNGRDCLWGGGDCQSTIKFTDPSTITPLECGDNHLQKWGITGYDTVDHWCSVSRDYFNHPWSCLLGYSTPMRYVGGNIECMSLNAHDCLWEGDCFSKLPMPVYDIRPLVCGQRHKHEWGTSGYDDPNHWCTQSLALIGQDADPVHEDGPWLCILDIVSPIRWNANDQIECMSLNQHDCIQDGNCYTTIEYVQDDLIEPLTCGEQLMLQWGISGYDTPNHWCRISKDYLSAGWTCVGGYTTPIRYVAGNVECMSLDHHTCMWDDGPCQDKLDTPVYTIQPLTCGDNHEVEWGINGYDDLDHWCAQALSVLAP